MVSIEPLLFVQGFKYPKKFDTLLIQRNQNKSYFKQGFPFNNNHYFFTHGYMVSRVHVKS